MTSQQPVTPQPVTPDSTAPADSPLLARPGAVPADGPDAGTAWHYGDPVREQRSLADGDALVDLSHRGVVTVAGPDRLSWLDTLSTQWLRDLPAGRSAEAMILSPNGHIEHVLHVVDDGDRAWLTVEPGCAPALVAHLEKMRFMLRVEVADVTADWAVVGAAGADVPGGPTWTDPWPDGGPETTARYSTVQTHPAHGRVWTETLVPRGDLARTVGERPLAGSWASEALRVEAWRPRFGFETDHRTIPHELDWLRTAVHLQKGCYRGQETVARVHNLGRPPRRLVFLHLDGSTHELPARGAEITPADGGRAVGRVTTVARHHELGPIALAVLKRNTDPEAPLLVDGTVSAAQEVVVAP